VTPLFVEPDVLFKAAAQQQARQGGRHSQADHWGVCLTQDTGQYFVKISQGSADTSQASTIVHAEQLLGTSAAFKHFTIEDADLYKYHLDLPALYKADAEFAAFWASRGNAQW